MCRCAVVRKLAVKLYEKAGAALVKIEADMTQEELDEVKSLQDKAVNALTSAKSQMGKVLAEAEATAKTRLKELKAKRISK